MSVVGTIHKADAKLLAYCTDATWRSGVAARVVDRMAAVLTIVLIAYAIPVGVSAA